METGEILIAAEAGKQILDLIAEKFKQEAYAYVVLDYAVAFGEYCPAVREIRLGIGNETEARQLEWDYLQELRIFTTEAELKIVKIHNKYFWRLRRSSDQGHDEYVVPRKEKLWGKINLKASGVADWIKLTSAQGSFIQIPVRGNDGTWGADEVWLKLCYYYEERDVEQHAQLVYQKDMRIEGFCLPDNCKTGGEAIG